jgi:hypothetical protein
MLVAYAESRHCDEPRVIISVHKKGHYDFVYNDDSISFVIIWNA